MEFNKIYLLDCIEGLKSLPDNSIDMGITSPPYNKLGLMEGKKQKSAKGHEDSRKIWKSAASSYQNYDDNRDEESYKAWQVEVLNEIQRVLKPGGSFFYNHKNRRYNKTEYSPAEWILKSKLNIYQTIVWDRKADPNFNDHFFVPIYELVFWLTKDNKESPKFFKDRCESKTSIWSILPEKNLPHPAPFPAKLVRQCILATTEENDVVLDPFMGMGITAMVAKRLGRRFIGFEISGEYINIYEELMNAISPYSDKKKGLLY